MKDLILIGAGGHSKSCIEVIENEGKYKISGLLDLSEKVGEALLGYPIIGTDNDIKKYLSTHSFLITLGQIHTAKHRIKLFQLLKEHNVKLATIISPLAYVSKHATLGEGTIVMAHAFVNAGASIGTNCIINTKALIEHDCTIENNCHISISAVLAGEVCVKENSFIGANTIITQGVQINANSFIKAGQIIKE